MFHVTCTCYHVTIVYNIKMAEKEQSQPLLGEDKEDIPAHPPPGYEPTKNAPNPLPAMPLPTYAQSEKYEKDGVLEFGSNHEEDDSDHGVSEEYSDGTCCEFTIFFMICAIFSVVGFIFSFCLATTVAAQSGALAGLGIAFISKPIVFEMYDTDHVQQHWKQNYCNDYWGYGTNEDVESCVQRNYSLLRFFFWLIGLLGLYLFYKGTANFMRTHRLPSREE